MKTDQKFYIDQDGEIVFFKGDDATHRIDADTVLVGADEGADGFRIDGVFTLHTAKISRLGIDRDELALILGTVARDGLPGPRDLDVALDAIISSIEIDLGTPEDIQGDFEARRKALELEQATEQQIMSALILKPVTDRRCGTCTFYFLAEWLDIGDPDAPGDCQFRDGLPTSMAGVAQREREPMYPHEGKTCPCWEIK